MTILPALSARAVRRAALAFALLGAAALVWLAASQWGERQAVARLRDQAETALSLSASVLRSEIAKQRSVPVVLAGDPEVRAALLAGGGAAHVPLSRRLRELAATTDASVLYLLDRTGLAIAASNFEEPVSFVGSDYRFRRYFTDAMAKGSAEQYALGTVSRRPGLYIARRVEGADGAAIGVVVLKMEMDRVEAAWRGAGPVFAEDDRGVVLVTSVPDWRYGTTEAVDAPAAAEIRESLQFANAPLAPLPLARAGDETLRIEGGGERFVEASGALADAALPWRVHLLLPAGAVIAASGRAAGQQAVTLGAASAALAAYGWRRRRRGRLEAVRLREETARLERRVAERTRDLADSNARLRAEIERRENGDRQVAALRADLEQAGRLSFLGQITAGVAHEIAQPVGAIRAFAENAGRFLAAGETGAADGNMTRIVALTERIGTITQALRGFSRRGAGLPEGIAIGEAIAGSRLLLQHRFERGDVALAVEGPTGGRVRAERVRLEQVLVNLLQNAIEASEGRDDARVTIGVEEGAGTVSLTVRDNGPGLSPAVLETLFVPFRTTKPRGLGLGLVIAHDIVAEWGGTLRAANGEDGGACFTLQLVGMPA